MLVCVFASGEAEGLVNGQMQKSESVDWIAHCD